LCAYSFTNLYEEEREQRLSLILNLLQHMGSSEDVSARIQADTDVRINEMKKAVQRNKEKVSDCCLERANIIAPRVKAHLTFVSF